MLSVSTPLLSLNLPSNLLISHPISLSPGNRFVQYAGVGMQYETHGGEDVGIYAQGRLGNNPVL